MVKVTQDTKHYCNVVNDPDPRRSLMLTLEHNKLSISVADTLMFSSIMFKDEKEIEDLIEALIAMKSLLPKTE